MKHKSFALAFAGTVLVSLMAVPYAAAQAATVSDEDLQKIEHVVVIYAENRSFDNLFGLFPGADGIDPSAAASHKQVDRDGTALPHLPPVWVESKTPGDKPVADPRYKGAIANAPFVLNDPSGPDMGLGERTRDLVHRFYQHKEQIDGGKLDRFAAVSDAGGLSMGYYDGSSLDMWALARRYTLADHFFMGAYGGSFLNHLWLVCACTPKYPDLKGYPSLSAKDKAVLAADGTLKRATNSPKSALDGPPIYVRDTSFTPKGEAINTLQPPFQPSFAAPDPNDPRKADPADKRRVLPPLSVPTIGDRLSEKGVTWAWYAQAWDEALKDRSVIYSDAPGSPNFMPHHQPFNYFAQYAPGTDARKTHLKDGDAFMRAIGDGTLEAVTFFKPEGALNEHPGYANIEAGDRHVAQIVHAIMKSPLWRSTLIIVTYDENGGFYDHVAPPQGDEWGPGSRVPAILISPYVKRHYVDHTSYDTTSILKFITRRYALEPLPGLRAGAGDLTGALDFDVPWWQRGWQALRSFNPF